MVDAAYAEPVEYAPEPDFIEIGDERFIDFVSQPGPDGSPVNIADHVDDDLLNKLALHCIEGYERDKDSRADWEEDFDAAMAMLRQEKVAKNFPFDGCANVQYPLLTTACIQFNARAYPAILPGPEVVKARITGDDPDGLKAAQGDRVAEHMSFQLTEEMPEWDRETDALLLHLPAVGMAFRQITWDSEHQRPKSEFISAKRLVVNNGAQSLETVPLFTKEFDLYPHEVVERQRKGIYLDVEVEWTGEHAEAKQDMLEAHVRYDLDDDGYAEPYIVTIHKESQTVLAVVAGWWPQDVQRKDGKIVCIKRRVLIEDYGFIPDPEGGFYSIGFGRLLRVHNEIVNTIINQLLDAATLQNAGGGFIGNQVRLDGGRIEFAPGEWKMINDSGNDLRASIVPAPVPQPSPVLFELLGLMIDSGREVASIKDVLSGEAPANQPATTTLALIEQGMQVFTAIYKRVYRSLKGEFDIIFDLNSAFLPEEAYFNVLDDPKAIKRIDYDRKTMDVRPVADPSATTQPQRLARAQFLWATFSQDPLMDPKELRLRVLRAANIEDVDKLFKPEPEGPDPAMQLAAEAAATDVAAKAADIKKTEAETAKIEAETIKLGVDIEPQRRALATQDAIIDEERAAEALVGGGMGGMAGAPGNGAPVQQPQEVLAPPAGGLAAEGMGGAPAVGPMDAFNQGAG